MRRQATHRVQAASLEGGKGLETTAGQLTIIVIICKVGLGHPLGNDATAGAAGFPEAVTVRLPAGVGFLQEAGLIRLNASHYCMCCSVGPGSRPHTVQTEGHIQSQCCI